MKNVNRSGLYSITNTKNKYENYFVVVSGISPFLKVELIFTLSFNVVLNDILQGKEFIWKNINVVDILNENILKTKLSKSGIPNIIKNSFINKPTDINNIKESFKKTNNKLISYFKNVFLEKSDEITDDHNSCKTKELTDGLVDNIVDMKFAHYKGDINEIKHSKKVEIFKEKMCDIVDNFSILSDIDYRENKKSNNDLSLKHCIKVKITDPDGYYSKYKTIKCTEDVYKIVYEKFHNKSNKILYDDVYEYCKNVIKYDIKNNNKKTETEFWDYICVKTENSIDVMEINNTRTELPIVLVKDETHVVDNIVGVLVLPKYITCRINESDGKKWYKLDIDVEDSLKNTFDSVFNTNKLITQNDVDSFIIQFGHIFVNQQKKYENDTKTN